jgi:hypothetical protein
MGVIQLMSDEPVDGQVENHVVLWETRPASTGSFPRTHLAAPGWGRRVDSQTYGDQRKWVVTHNPQALQHLLPFISLSLLNRTGSFL